MNKNNLFYILLFSSIVIPFVLFSQSEDNVSENIKSQIGARKYINNFDYDAWYYRLYPKNSEYSEDTKVMLKFDSIFKYEGERSLKCSYEFLSQKLDSTPIVISLQKIWTHNYRSDLSFYPLGVSLWLNSSGSNDRFTINLLQQNQAFTLKSHNLHSFTYSNDTVLKKKGWQQIVISYEWFKPSHVNPDEKLNLSRIDGYQFNIENISQEPHSGTIHFDAFEQLTSYEPVIKDIPRFTSTFISLNYRHNDYDWDKLFNAYHEVGIDSVIIQYSAREHKTEKYTNFFYETSNINWEKQSYKIIEDIFPAADRTGIKIILGLHGGRYPKDRGDAEVYDELFRKNQEIVDDLYSKFAKNESLAGWYIVEEFHDGANNGWWKYEDRMLLASYQQKVAAYAKSKDKELIVAIAPALWRGRPADMTYEFFKSYFERTPDIDILYLQDCGGRCSVNQDDFDVVLPHWYSYIKKACDETGVQFGVDIETFKRCPAENIKLHSKSWANLKIQLEMAGMFTKNITLYSWLNFRPDVGAFNEYREYLKQNGLLRKPNKVKSKN